MTVDPHDDPWAEGPVSELWERIGRAEADRDRAVNAVKELRIALEGLVESEIPKPCWCAFTRDTGQKHSLACLAARRTWAATAEWETP